MPNKYRAEIPELRGWGDLSDEERNEFLEAHPAVKDKSFKQASVAYDNLKFINAFGKDTFGAYSKAERDMMFRTKMIDDALEQHFKGDKNLDTFSTLTDEGKLDLLRSNYRTQDELEKINDTTDKAMAGVSALSRIVGGAGGAAVEQGAESFIGATGLLDTILGKEQKDVGDFSEQFFRQRNDTILSHIIAKDNKRKQESVGDRSFEIENAIKKNMSVDEIKHTADELAGNEQFGSPHYKAFKDAREMRNFDSDDQAKLIADFYAMSEKYGMDAAVSNLYTSMQDYVAKHQDFWDYWVEGTLQNVNTKAAANLFNHILGYEALYKSFVEGPESVANFAEGKRKDGTPIKHNVMNPSYWEGVDTFNTFNPDEIKAARENGGVSKEQAIAPAGKEMGFKTSISEGIKMAGFAASDLLYNYALGALGKGVAKGLGAKFTSNIFKPSATINPETSGTLGGKFYENVFPWVVAANSGLGISMAYSMGTYQQTLDEINQNIDAQISRDADSYIESMRGTDEYNKAVGEVATQKLAQLQAENPDKYIDFKDVKDNLFAAAAQEVDGALYERYLTDPKIQEGFGRNYQEDRDMARKHAAAAFSADFITEELRMTLAGVSWKTFLYDKGTRGVLANKFPGLHVAESEGTLAPEAAKRARYAAVAKNIYGGFHSNYWDDVTVAFGKGIGLNKSNDYMAMKYNPEGYAVANDKVGGFIKDFAAGMDRSFEALFEPQSFYDGFIGALGTPLSFSINPGAVFKGERAIKRSDVKTKKNPNGKYHWTEFASQFVVNPVIQEYGDAVAREREFQPVVDRANQVIAEHKKSLEDIGEVVMSLNSLDYNRQHADSYADAEDSKTRAAFTLVSKVRDWANDPIMSKSSVVQNAVRELNELNNFDSLSEERKQQLVSEFLAQPDNKSVKEGADPEINAAERIKKNAKFISDLSQKYDEAIKKIESSKDFRAVKAGFVNADEVAKQLAFMDVMDDNWHTRLAELNSDIQGSENYTTATNPVIYGNKRGVEIEIAARNKEIEELRKEMSRLEKGKTEVVKEDNNVEQVALDKSVRDILVNKVKTDIRRKENEIAELKSIDDSAFSSVLSKDAILALSPSDRAYMLNPRNLTRYSREQQVEITSLTRELKMKDPELLNKIEDAGVLQHRIEDNQYAYEFLGDHPVVAASYIDHMAADRASTATSVFGRLAYDYADNKMDEAFAVGQKAFLREARKKNSTYLADYIARNPDKSETLQPAVSVAKLRDDTQTAVKNVFLKDIDRQGVSDDVKANLVKKANAVGNFIDSAISKSNANTVPGILRSLEGLIDSQPEGTLTKELDAVLDELQAMDYQRNSTILKKREKRKEEERKKEEEERKSNGKYYGWNGFRTDDDVYTLDGNKKGKVSSFNPLTRGGEMVVTLDDGSKRVVSSDDRRYISKTPFKQTMEDAKNKLVEGTLHDANAKGTVFTGISEEVVLTDEGTPKEKSEEQKFKDTVAAVNTTPIQQPATSSEDAANTIATAGVLVGNAFYKYDAAALSAGVLEERKGTSEGDTMNQVFSWLNDRKIDLQNIIDNEFSEIIRRYPDTKIQFMFTKPDGSAMDRVVFNVIEYTDKIAKFHVEKRGEDNVGGVFDVDGKRYLVVGMLGYNGSQMKDAFTKPVFEMRNSRSDYFNTHQDQTLYIDPKYNTRVYEMSGGRKVKAENQEDKVQYRSLKDLFDNHNPRNMKLEDAMFGMSFKSQSFVLFSQIPGSVIYAPSVREGGAGGVFLMIPASDWGYLPAYIRKVTFGQLNDGVVKDRIQDTIDNLTAQDYNVRNAAIKELYKLLVLTDDKNISIGNPSKNVISVKNNGITTFESALDANFRREEFLKAIDDAGFIVNITPETLQNAQSIMDYDAAGALQTDIARLSTANLSYSVLQMGQDGNPIAKPKQQAAPQQTVKESLYKTSAVIANKVYRKDADGYYYEDGSKIDTNTQEGKILASEIDYITYIDGNKITPAFVNQDGSREYIINADRKNPDVVMRTADNHILFADNTMALSVIDRANEEARKVAAEKAAREVLEKQINSFPEVNLTDGGETVDEAVPPSTPIIPSSQSAYVGNESSAENKGKTTPETKTTQDINKPGSKSLSELQRPRENITFADIHASRRKELNQIAKDKGWGWGKTVSEKERFLNERNISTVGIKNEDSFIQMLKDCK